MFIFILLGKTSVDKPLLAGASIPLWGNYAFPPYFRKKFQTAWEIFPILPFQKTFSDFHPPKFSKGFFSNWLNIFNFHLISLFEYISSLFQKNYYFLPTFANFPLPDFVKFTCFLHTLCVFRSLLIWPWCTSASHNVRRLLDAPGYSNTCTWGKA